MLRRHAATRIQSAIERLVARGALPAASYPDPDVEPPRQAEHGDLATNWAMAAFKLVGGTGGPASPRALGELLAAELLTDASFATAEVAGPGFVNVTLASGLLEEVVDRAAASADRAVLDDQAHFARPLASDVDPLRVNIEYVSVNPNGPITIGSGRGAAYGSTLANVLQAAGHEVHREYYINDGVNSEQMRLFAESVKAVCEGRPLPENGYRGDYVTDVARSLVDVPAKESERSVGWFQAQAQRAMLSKQCEDLEAFGVAFDTWFSEQSLHDSGAVERHIEALVAAGAADEEPYRTKLKLAKGGVVESAEHEDQAAAVDAEDEDAPSSEKAPAANSTGRSLEGTALWLRSTKFGDDMDRVLRRKDGRLTYIASDIAYHADKFTRPPNADKLITILGPDHHGYIGRLHAVVAAVLRESQAGTLAQPSSTPLSDWESLVYASPEERDACRAALAESEQKLEVLIFQLVRFLKDGKPAPMRKRDGNIYALIDLVNEVGAKVKPSGTAEERLAAGKDVARFFYLMRHHDTTFDFDLDLAEKQSDENPVFYAQYAHARVCSVIAKAKESGFEPAAARRPGARELHLKERALILKIADLPHEVARCAEDYGVNRLTTYAVELARVYHHFYDACRVIDPDDPATSAWRLELCVATKTALRATFDLLGISAPERMEREPSPGEASLSSGA